MTPLRSIPGRLLPPDRSDENLPYSIDVFDAADKLVEVLGRLAEPDTARVAFNTTVAKHANRRIFLQNGGRVIMRSHRPI
jgi:hypothetical protein